MERLRLNACDTIRQSVSSVLDIRDYLAHEEEISIHRQFQNTSWKPNCQILWSGMLREQAQTWADEHEMQTLTTAMGPLMDPRTPHCLYHCKSAKAWSKYIHGASAVFAWHIAKGDVVTVLCPPPPQRFHPSGLAFYQTIEEPILRAAIAEGASLRIELIHPLVHGAQDFRYQYLPTDEEDTFIATFGSLSGQKRVWRLVKGGSLPSASQKIVKTQIAAPANSTSPKEQVRAVVKSVNRSLPKKSRKKKKKGRKQASCTATVNVTDAIRTTSKTSGLASHKIATCLSASVKCKATKTASHLPNKSQLSKGERKALKAHDDKLGSPKATSNISAKMTRKTTGATSEQTIVSTVALKLTKGHGKKTRRAKKQAAKQATQQNKKLSDKQAKQEPKKEANLAKHRKKSRPKQLVGNSTN